MMARINFDKYLHYYSLTRMGVLPHNNLKLQWEPNNPNHRIFHLSLLNPKYNNNNKFPQASPRKRQNPSAIIDISQEYETSSSFDAALDACSSQPDKGPHKSLTSNSQSPHPTIGVAGVEGQGL